MEILKTLYSLIGAPYPLVSLVIAALVGAMAFGGGWWLIGKQYQKENQSLSFQEKTKTRNGVAHTTARPDAIALSPSVAADSRDATEPSDKASQVSTAVSNSPQKVEVTPVGQDGDPNKYKLMYNNAKRLSLSIDRDKAIDTLIETALKDGKPEVAANYVNDLSLSIYQDKKYKQIIDIAIQQKKFQLAENLAGKLSLGIYQDDYRKKIIDAISR